MEEKEERHLIMKSLLGGFALRQVSTRSANVDKRNQEINESISEELKMSNPKNRDISA